MTRDDLLQALQHNNVQAFARVVRQGESRQDDEAYRMRYGGAGKAPAYFDDLSQHPHIFEPTPGGQRSSAAGAYQATWTTWNEEQQRWGFPDFSPQSQDEFFVARLIYRRALDAVIAGRFDEACRLCRAEWTSLPGGAEHNAATARARETYIGYGGTFAEETQAATPPERKDMLPLPLIVAGIDALREFIPAIASVFKPGSEVAARNVQAAQVIFDTVARATDSPNVQAAIERMQADPQIVQAAKDAVHEVLPQLIEAGAGGIDGARKAAMNAEQLPFYKQPAVLFVAATLPLVYAIVGAVVLGWGGRDFSDEVKVMVVTAILGLLGTAGAYFLGSSNSSQKKDAALAAAAK